MRGARGSFGSGYMFHTIYIEEGAAEHPRTEQICSRFPNANRIFVGRYGEVFNRKGQNFRLQKKRPALILARKFGRLVLPAPNGYGVRALMVSTRPRPTLTTRTRRNSERVVLR